ncbi:S1C family serine protease [Flexivirga sp. B27]
MSFEQHPADDDRGNTASTSGDGAGSRPGSSSSSADATGRIYTTGDQTAHLPAHRPEAPQPHPGQQAPQPGQQSPFGAPYGGQQAPQPTQQPGPHAQQQGHQQPAYAAAPAAQGPYAAPSYAGGQQGSFPGGPYNPGNGNGNTNGGPKRSKRWLAIPVVAILAAALASGGTWALTKDDASGGGTTNKTVVKADPADFANAGTVDWSATASKVSPSVVAITVRSGNSGDQGSGVVLDKDGNIVTNNHVVSGAGSDATVTVTLSNNQTYKAKVVGKDSSTDLAVIKLENPPDDLTPIEMGDDSKLVVGQPVMAVGNPLGLAGTATTGIVSALNRPITTRQQSQGGDDNPFGGSDQSEDNSSTTNAIQTSAAINPGNSGGALVSGSGKLIGVNSSIATLGQSSGSSQSGNIGIGFAIPVSVVKNITSQLMKDGKVRHPQIGVQVARVAGTVKLGDATVQAAKIVKVNSGSPGDKAGLKEGDMVTKVNGKQIGSPPSDSLIGYVRAHNVGDKITLTIVRGGKQQDVTVTLGEASS